MKHTPGPWTLEYDYSLVMPAKDGNHIVTGGPIGPDEASREEKRANARLIAAAPELLEAIELLSKILFNTHPLSVDQEHVKLIINSAIQKATQP